MTPSAPSLGSPNRAAPLLQLPVWSLMLIVLYVAIAIVDIQDQRRSEPALIALASAGFLGYGLLAWLTWHYSRRFEARLGGLLLVILYLVATAALFLLATVVYLVLEYAYLRGHFW